MKKAPPIFAALVSLPIAFAAAGACWWAAGPSLGLFFGGIAFAAVLTPALVCGESTCLGRFLAAAGIWLGIGVVWLAAVFTTDTTLGQWTECAALLAAFILAMAGLCVVLMRLRFSPVAAAAVVTVLSLAWLTWPVWLAPALHGSAGQGIVSWLVPAHPLFAANAAVSNLGIWSEQTLIYRWSNMNQDLIFSLPRTVWPAVGLHAGIGIVFVLTTWRRRAITAET